MDKLNDLFTKIITKLNKKVDSEEGKGLSTNDFTTEEQTKLSEIEEGAQVNTIETITLNGTPVPPDEAKNVEIKAYNEDNKPEVGGRNLLLDSGRTIRNSSYNIGIWRFSERMAPKDGERTIISLKGSFGEDRTFIQFFNSGGNLAFPQSIVFNTAGKREGVFTTIVRWSTGNTANNELWAFIYPQSATSVNTIEWIKLERGEIPTDWTPAPEDLAPIDEQKILAQIANRTYQGTDLTVKFKSEIDGSFSGNPWAWIQDRINNANWDGLHVCDYIPFTTEGLETNVTMQAQIAGMNTYYQYSDQPIPHHIDFITREVWPTLHTFNPVNYNNGTAAQNCPWLASDMYLWLNSLSGSVPNATTVNPTLAEVNYTKDGVYYFLPANLKAVIVEKHLLLSKRYSASGLLDDDNGWGWQNAGKLWLPTEMEVYGTNVFGGAGYPTGGGIQYPIFANSMNRLKYRSGSRCGWWLSTPYSGGSTRWCSVYNIGHASNGTATYTWIGAPVCFRIASTVKSANMSVEGPEMMDEYMQYDEALSPEFEKPIDRSSETEDEPLTE